MVKAKQSTKGKGTGKADKATTAPTKAVKAAVTALSVLAAWSLRHIVSVTYNGVTIVNPNSKTPFLQALRIAATAANDTPANGDKVSGEAFARARAIFALAGGFSYANDKGRTMASAKSEIRAYTLHEFAQRKHNARQGNIDACADFARMLWAGKGTAKLITGNDYKVADLIEYAVKLTAPTNE